MIQFFLPISRVGAHITERAAELLLFRYTPVHIRIDAAIERPGAMRSPTLFELINDFAARER